MSFKLQSKSHKKARAYDPILLLNENHFLCKKLIYYNYSLKPFLLYFFVSKKPINNQRLLIENKCICLRVELIVTNTYF